MKNVMKKAHEITKKIIRKGDSYRATFKLALSLAHSLMKKGVNKMVELIGSEKQIKWANDIRSKFIKINEIFEEASKNINKLSVSEYIEDTRNNIDQILKQDSAVFYIEKLKNLNDTMIQKASQRKDEDKIMDTWTLTNSILDKM